MIVGRWHVQFAAVCRRYLLLCIYMLFHFLLFLSNLFLCFSLVLTNQTDWSLIPACPSLLWLKTCFNKGNACVEGKFVSDLCASLYLLL